MATNCPIAVPTDSEAATVDDFVAVFGEVETVELSNIDDAGSSYNCERLNLALVDAYRYLTTAERVSAPIGAVVIRGNLRRWMLIVARYYLDTIRKREDVKAEYMLIDKFLADNKALGNSFGNVVYSEPGTQSVISDELLLRSNSTYNG